MRVDLLNAQVSSSYVLLLLGGVAFLIYGETFQYPWLFDDFIVIVNNTDIRSLPAFFANDYPGRPIREITFLLDYSIFGLNPSGFHFQNILWHFLNAFLIYCLCLAIGLSRTFSIVAALIFVAHPVNVEVVAQTSHRKDSLSLFFTLLSLLSYNKFIESKNKVFYIICTVICIIIAIMSKQVAIMSIPVLIAFEYFIIPKEKRFLSGRSRTFSILAISFFLIVLSRICYLHLSKKIYQNISGILDQVGDGSPLSITSYYLTIIKSQAFLLSKWINPISLAPEYTFMAPVGFGDLWVVSGSILFLVFLWGFWWAFKNKPAIAFTLAWTFLFWLPTSNILGHFSSLAADRYLYTPGAGLAIMCGSLLQDLPWKKTFFVFSAILLLLLCKISADQVKNWSSPVVLSTHIGKVNPLSVENQITKAAALIDSGDYDEAISQLRALALRRPTYTKIHRNMTLAYSKKGDINQAIYYAQLWIRCNPNDFEAYNFLGSLLDEKGEIDKAVIAFKRAISINQFNELAYTNLGVLYERQGRYSLATELHKSAISNLPDYGMGYYNLGVAYYRSGDKQKAFESFGKASELLTDNADALFNHGYVAAELGYFPAAEKTISVLKVIDGKKARELKEHLDSHLKKG